MLARDVDAKFKHMRADSYGQPPVPNDFFISKGRTPWAYRACGAGVIPGDRDLPYPRICAHRGFNYVAPENSLPAFGAAVALGAVEIELDVWPTKDGELIISHDESVKRLTGADRLISDMTLAEVRALDIGSGMASPLRRAALSDASGGFRSLRPPNHREPAHQVAPRLHGV